MAVVLPAARAATTDGTASAVSETPVRVTLTLPFFGTSNAVSDSANVTNMGAGPDADLAPDLQVDWARQFGPVRLTTILDTTAERFPRHPSESSDSIFGSIRLALTDGVSERFVPFVLYRAGMDFTPLLATRQDTLQYLAAGVRTGFGLTAAGAMIGRRDADKPGQTAIWLEAQAGRRFANPADLDLVYAQIKGEVQYTVSPTVQLTLAPTVRGRHYDLYYGSPRQDLFLELEGTVAWTPSWLTKVNPDAELDFVVTFDRNLSTYSSARYVSWTGGPQIMLGWKF
ncbi:MAG TPA: hypothetical protein VJY39_07740 [Acidisphaera sp.]|nr:hypothetical protein [Acidisphaera sp.]